MPERKQIVINTGPLLALAAALERFALREDLYAAEPLPYEVCAEVRVGGSAGFAADLLQTESWLCTADAPTDGIPSRLYNSLYAGEAALIHCAMTHGIETAAMEDCLEKSAPSDHLTSSAVNSGGMSSR